MYFWIITIFLVTSLATSAAKEPQKCKFDRVHKMVAYNCANIKLNAIPRFLKSSAEILDASENRIRKLTKDSFSNYKKLKFLYLFENMILKAEAGTFSQLELLETLDLSSNGLRSVPSDILNLPLLRKLYLADNELRNEGFASIKKPVRAPLVYLNIAITEIDKIPDLGILAELLSLNVSGNTMKHLTPQQFAPLCQLKFIDLNQTKIDACQCQKINIFMEIELKRSPILNCGKAPKNCNIRDNSSTLEAKDYLTCLNVQKELIQKTRITSSEISWPPVVFCSIIALLFIVMIYVHCSGGKPTNRPQQIEIIPESQSSESELPVNPNSRNTLIM